MQKKEQQARASIVLGKRLAVGARAPGAKSFLPRGRDIKMERAGQL
ncbi:MAG: hypothetical protein ABFD97_17685 [Syntrophobacter sp.]